VAFNRLMGPLGHLNSLLNTPEAKARRNLLDTLRKLRLYNQPAFPGLKAMGAPVIIQSPTVNKDGSVNCEP